MKFSVIITASNEGVLAHKTMLCVLAALAKVKATYEIIVTIDHGSPETKTYFSRYAKDKQFRIFENEFDDVGKSRNFAAQQARSKYLFFLDADDLITDNYFEQSLEILEQAKTEIVVHPEYCLSFEDCNGRCVLQRMGESESPAKDAFLLFGRNRWVSALGGLRDTFLAHPYLSTGQGYGHEDYTLNIELSAAGVQHRIAPETVYFYRHKPTSLLSQNLDKYYTQPYSELFDFRKWQKMELPKSEFAEFAPLTKTQRLQKNYVALRNNKIINAFIAPVATLAKRITGKKLIPEATKISPVVMRAWKQIAKIETQLYPVPLLTDYLTHYTTENYSLISEAYWRICQQIKALPNYVFLVPWVVSGGSDKVLLNYLKALQEVQPQWKIAVIATMPVIHEWQHKLPENAFLIDFGNIAQDLSIEEQELLFTRLLVQLKAKKLHIINSDFACGWVRLHQELVKSHMKLYFSLFCHGILVGTNAEGIWDFADPNATRVYHLIKKIYTDNTAVVRRLVAEDGFDADKIVVHHQPVTPIANSPKHAKSPDDKLRILWAGRVSVQKNPELLVRIAQKLDPEKVHIEAFGRIDPIESEGFQFPTDLSTLTYRGKFDDLHSLNLSNYDILLYTSRIDGLPNIILEAAAAGLPIVASDVGGVGDFIKNQKTGFLIHDADNEDAYIDIINQIQQSPELLPPISKAAKKLTESEYSWKNFIKTVKKDFK